MQATHHLRDLVSLLEELNANGSELQSHEYSSTSFGSFLVVLGKGHKKARFVWDGKESVLTIEYQVVQNQTIAGAWQHDAYVKISTSESVFPEIGSNAIAMLE